MKTNFQDVAHLYIGCKIKTKEGIGTFSALHTPGTVKPKSAIPITSYDLIKSDLHFKEVKPMLRLLNDMTEAEAKQICKIVSEPYLSYNIFKERVHISTTSTTEGHKDDSSIWLFYDGQTALYRNNGDWGGSRMEQLKNPYLLMLYLIKQRFDLFSLIKNKQAVLLKTKKQK